MCIYLLAQVHLAKHAFSLKSNQFWVSEIKMISTVISKESLTVTVSKSQMQKKYFLFHKKTVLSDILGL